MLKYRHGDAVAFETLYRRHRAALYRYILRQCRHSSIADELFQDVWMKLIRARERYEVKARFTTWLFQMAHNHMIDYYRGVKRGAVEVDCVSGPELFPARVQDQPEQQAVLDQQSSRILAAIEDLPLEQRQVFLLKEEAGKSLQEIAEITGVNPETVKSRLRYALKKIREALSE